MLQVFSTPEELPVCQKYSNGPSSSAYRWLTLPSHPCPLDGCYRIALFLQIHYVQYLVSDTARRILLSFNKSSTNKKKRQFHSTVKICTNFPVQQIQSSSVSVPLVPSSAPPAFTSGERHQPLASEISARLLRMGEKTICRSADGAGRKAVPVCCSTNQGTAHTSQLLGGNQ